MTVCKIITNECDVFCICRQHIGLLCLQPAVFPRSERDARHADGGYENYVTTNLSERRESRGGMNSIQSFCQWSHYFSLRCRERKRERVHASSSRSARVFPNSKASLKVVLQLLVRHVAMTNRTVTIEILNR